MLFFDLVFLDTTPSLPTSLVELQNIAEADLQSGIRMRIEEMDEKKKREGGRGWVGEGGERRGEEEEGEEDEERMLFSQSAWDNVGNDEDWDSFFDLDAWSSFINEGFVGANVKDDPPLPRFKKPTGSGRAAHPMPGALKPVAPTLPVVTEKTVISLGLNLQAPGIPARLDRKKLKSRADDSSWDITPVRIEKLPPRLPTEQTSSYEWFDIAYKRSPTYGKAKEFVEDEALFGSCGTSIIASRNWAQTLLPLGPFRYLGRAKNPCWYPDDGGPFSCMPHFHLAGVSGPATRDVLRHLLVHPHLLPAPLAPRWWDLGRQAGDSSGTYFSSPTGWERLSGNENCVEPRVTLASHLRRLRLKGLVLVVLPHPTRRLIAEAQQKSRDGKLNGQQFHTDVEKAIRAYRTCFSRASLRQCAYNATLADSVKLSLHEGLYSIYMEDWVRIFPPEQFLVVRYEDFVNSTVPTLQAIFEFLNVPTIVPAELSVAVSGLVQGFRDTVLLSLPPSFLPSFLPSFTHSLTHSLPLPLPHPATMLSVAVSGLVQGFRDTFLLSFFPSFPHSFLPPSLLPSFLPSFLHSLTHSASPPSSDNRAGRAVRGGERAGPGVPGHGPSFPPSFLPSFLPSLTHSLTLPLPHPATMLSVAVSGLVHGFRDTFLLSFLPSFPHSFLPPSLPPSFLPFFLPSLTHSLTHSASPPSSDNRAGRAVRGATIVAAELSVAVSGLVQGFQDTVRAHNAGGGVWSRTVHTLNDFYSPFLVRLAQIMGGDPKKFTWQDT
ncbi:hypothetical protein ACOMHN_023751 [Nucella lapillus]